MSDLTINSNSTPPDNDSNTRLLSADYSNEIIIENKFTSRDSQELFPLSDHHQAPEKDRTESNIILNGYLYGQLANVGKFALTWTTLSPLILSLFKGSSYGVGGSRLSFNLAMCIISPIAGTLINKGHILSWLTWTGISRCFLYSILLPFLYILFQSGWLFEISGLINTFFQICFFLFMFIDGSFIAFSNIVDIDAGGTDLLGIDYGLTITDKTRNRLNSIFEGSFDAFMMILSPLSALLALLIRDMWTTKSNDTVYDSVSIISSLCISFFFLTVISLYFYFKYIPSPPLQTHSERNFSCSNLLPDIIAGMKLCWSHRAVRFRLLFLAFEIAFEDCMIALIISEFVVSGIYSNQNYAMANTVVALIIAVGKCAAILSSLYMHRYWLKADRQVFDYKILFLFTLLSSISTLLFPIASYLFTFGSISSYILAFLSSFFFFLFATPPKIGFSTLLQGLAATVDGSGRIFGFVASFITFTDSIILFTVSALFASFSLEIALWITSILIISNGIFEYILGPSLILGNE